MAKIWNEYLFLSKQNNEISDIKEILGEDFFEKMTDNKITYKHEDITEVFFYKIEQANKSLILKIGFDESIDVNTYEALESLVEQLRPIVGKNKFEFTVLKDSSSRYSNYILGNLFHEYEWGLRKLIYLIMIYSYDNNWYDSVVTDASESVVKERGKGRIDKSNLFQQFTFIEIEDFLFKKRYIKIREHSTKKEQVIKFEDLTNEDLARLLHIENSLVITEPLSLWKLDFSQYINSDSNDIQPDMTMIREVRNSLFHNKRINLSHIKECKSLLIKYNDMFSEVCIKIISGDITQESISEISNEMTDITTNPSMIGNKLQTDTAILSDISINSSMKGNKPQTGAAILSNMSIDPLIIGNKRDKATIGASILSDISINPLMKGNKLQIGTSILSDVSIAPLMKGNKLQIGTSILSDVSIAPSMIGNKGYISNTDTISLSDITNNSSIKEN